MKNFILTYQEFLNESSIDTKYWAAYNDVSQKQGYYESYSKKYKNFEDGFEEALTTWQSESMGDLNSKEIAKIRKIAEEFFKKEKWISIYVIHAMISQEA